MVLSRNDLWSQKMKKILLCVLMGLLFGFQSYQVAAKQYAILKADDFRNSKKSPSKAVDPGYLKFIKLIDEKKIKAGLGIVGKDLENPTSEYVALLKKLDGTGRYELWNHGYDHISGVKDSKGNILYAEFLKKPYNYQYTQLKKAQDILKKKVGVIGRSFGAPGNKIDGTTPKAIKANSDIKVWLLNSKITPPSGVLGLSNKTNIEWKIASARVPSFSKFKEEYSASKAYLLMQLHPAHYTDKAFAELEKIIDFLLANKVEFVLPYQYYQIKNGSSNAASNEPASSTTDVTVDAGECS